MNLTVKKNDTLRSLKDVLYLGEDVLDLTPYTVRAVFKKDGTVVRKDAMIVTASEGKVECEIPTEVITVIGNWLHEWELTDTNSKQITVPTEGYNVLTVAPDLA